MKLSSLSEVEDIMKYVPCFCHKEHICEKCKCLRTLEKVSNVIKRAIELAANDCNCHLFGGAKCDRCTIVTDLNGCL